MGAMTSPIPIQEELLDIDEQSLVYEYRATFRNETAYMPEISLRYLIYLILSNQSTDEIKRFANQVRIDLNVDRFNRTVNEISN